MSDTISISASPELATHVRREIELLIQYFTLFRWGTVPVVRRSDSAYSFPAMCYVFARSQPLVIRRLEARIEAGLRANKVVRPIVTPAIWIPESSVAEVPCYAVVVRRQ